ncbi:MAG: ligase-associated DNA damage response DEXH box helicase [Phycisphaeraceae bacterium]|nr:ligase-associated DNA damage response DEXH box helicase [Phycisphaeraceae bacterium]
MNGRIERWFTTHGWKPFDFQLRAWQAYRDGRSGLIHAPTGMGKTQAAWLGPVAEFLDEHPRPVPHRRRAAACPLRVLWITPLRALASDTTRALRAPVEALGLPWTVEQRTGDTGAALKARQRRQLPTALVTTPESLSLLLSYPDGRAALSTLRCVIVDEWHELIGSKRGVQVELALARLRRWNPHLRTWGLSATIGNTERAAEVLVGPGFDPSRLCIVRGRADRRTEFVTLLPDQIERFPWAGHLGTRLLGQVVAAIEGAGTSLLFTNTRSQAEIWFRQLTLARPDWLGRIMLHHGSLDRALRTEVEKRLEAADGVGLDDPARLKCVVCTSSLDLGVDFSPVDQVIQVGSPKGVARLLQRAGRSGHRPGAVSRLIGVPTHALELVEFAGARRAIGLGRLEDRVPVRLAFDVLAQHLVTVACGGGFEPDDLLAEVRSTHAYADLTDAQWSWALDFVRRGGPSLTAYPRHLRVAPDDASPGRLVVAGAAVARLHRLNIGTITADVAMTVCLASGRRLGTIEEGFVSRLRAGDRFVFAGRVLELLRIRDNAAIVRPATRASGAVPAWSGGRMPLSSHLSEQVVELFRQAGQGRYDSPELSAARPLIELQRAWSRLPAPGTLLIETTTSRQGHHAFVYPFAGRLVHEALAALLAHRLTRLRPVSVSAVCTDYGVELLGSEPPPRDEAIWRALLSTDGLLDDLLASLNSTQLARRQFREIARIAGLLVQGYPGQRSPARHLQASSEMFFDVFSQFDPDNLLLEQAQRELLEGQLEFRRLSETLVRIAAERIEIVATARLTPLAFPLWAEHIRSVHASGEPWNDRIRKMVVQLETSARRGTDARARAAQADRHGSTSRQARPAGAAAVGAGDA